MVAFCLIFLNKNFIRQPKLQIGRNGFINKLLSKNKTKFKPMLNYLKRNLIAALAVLALFTASCKKDGGTVIEPVAEKKGLQLKVDAKFGEILTDKEGKSLYFFASDVAGTPTCVGGCEAVWPLYYSADASTELKIDKALVGEITRADGKKQSTYKGYPLYYYAKDAATGDVNGDGVGSTWFVAKPDYTLMVANAQLVGDNDSLYLSTYKVGTGKTIYFTDAQGRTLYAFTNDKNGKNNFTRADFSNNTIWPIFEAEVKALPSVIAKDLVATIDVFGKKQVTYKGWPLYFFGNDKARGSNRGVSIGRNGPGTWPILNTSSLVAPLQ